MGKIRVGLVGVGCCASSLVQGVQFYRDTEENGFVPGLMHVSLGKYHVGDIEFSCAFDVDSNKVGKDLGEAIFAPINNTLKFCDVPPLGVKVSRGHTYDGLGKYYREVVTESPEKPFDVAKMLKETRTDVLVNYLPVGSEEATKFYMNEALKAGVGVVNCMPVFIASNPASAKKFEQAGLPIIGDDIKAQVGATITHRVLSKMFSDRGVILDRTSQFNFGGNMDFKNMLERERLESKKISKTRSVVSQLSIRSNQRISILAPRITSHGFRIANGPIYTWKDGNSAMYQSPSSSSWKYGIHQIAPALALMLSVVASWDWIPNYPVPWKVPRLIS